MLTALWAYYTSGERGGKECGGGEGGGEKEGEGRKCKEAKVK